MSSFTVTNDGAGVRVPWGKSDVPKIYPLPRFSPLVVNSMSEKNSGIGARLRTDKTVFVRVMSGSVAGAVNFAPRDCINDKNSFVVICVFMCPMCYSRPPASCALICAKRSSVALPPSPPPAVCAGRNTLPDGVGSHIVSQSA